MNCETLKSSLQSLYDKESDISVCIYAVLKGEDGNVSEPVKLDIEAEALAEIKGLFLDCLKDSISNQEDLSVLNLSSADERVNALYLYDIEMPEELLSLEKVVQEDDLPLLNFNDESLSSIKAILVEIGDNEEQVVLYKTIAPVNIYGRKSFFLKKSKSRLEKIDDEFLRLVPAFEMIRVNKKLLIRDLKFLEKSFGFHNIIKKNAELGVQSIVAKSIVANPDTLNELVADVSWSRKLMKVAQSSPVLNANVPNESIIQFCKDFPKLSNKIRFNDDNSQIVLDTKVSKKLFLQLLMDDFLTSELTKFHYESVAKDSLDSRNSETE